MSEQQIDLTTLDASALAARLAALRRFVCRSSQTKHPLPQMRVRTSRPMALND